KIMTKRIGRDRDIDPTLEQFPEGSDESLLRLSIGAVDDIRLRRSEGIPVRLVRVGHMSREDIRTQEAEIRQVSDRTLIGPLPDGMQLSQVLSNVKMDGDVPPAGFPSCLTKYVFGHRVGRVRRKVDPQPVTESAVQLIVETQPSLQSGIHVARV